jgi:hypothetical protein
MQGYEASMGTPSGTQQSVAYNTVIREATIRWAMIDHLEYPKRGFEDVIRQHFILKRNEIKAQLERWAKESTDSGHITRLRGLQRTLVPLLDRLK